MNEKLTAFIEKAKIEARETELQKRNAHLIKLGLLDRTKMWSKTSEITEEEYAELCKYSSPVTEKQATSIEDVIQPIAKNISIIKNIAVFFTVLWILGVIITVISLIAFFA